MKKNNLFTALLAFIIVSAGCNEAEEDDLAFVKEETIDAQTEDFFSHELNDSGSSVHFFEGWPNCDTLLVINSEEEFKKEYHGDLALPYIDFNNKTLIIGCAYLPQTNYYIKEARLENTPVGYSMIVSIEKNKNVVGFCEFYNAFFWKVYPKLQNKQISFLRKSIYTT